jgi:hydrogenase maturation protease
MECLVEVGAGAALEVSLRCLQLVARRPLKRARGSWQPVDELDIDGQRHVAFEEATERTFSTGKVELERLAAGVRVPARVADGESLEPLSPHAALLHSWQRLDGELVVAATAVSDGAMKVSVRFANRAHDQTSNRRQALASTFLSAHLVATGHAAAFVSQTDPPERLRGATEACINDGVWPVLVGEPGERDTLLGAPIILPDYPTVAPESPGAMYDSAEIDALLIHSIRALSDRERGEMCATDPRARRILERSLAVGSEQMATLHGAVRELRPLEQ